MPLFTYKARDRSGSLVTGSLEETSVAALESVLDSQGLIPVSIEETSQMFDLDRINRVFQTIRPEDKIIFTRQMATLFSAGIPFIKSLDTLATQALNPKMKEVIYTVKDDVEGGLSFANALKKHPDVFDDLYVHMIAAGEAGGVLDEILERLALSAEKEEAVRAKVKSAMLYPIIVVIVIIIAIIIMLYFVVPRFAALYSKYATELPLPTRMLLAMSDFFKQRWYIVIGAITSLIVGFKMYVKTKKGHRRWDRFKLKVMIFGKLNMKVCMSRFSRTFATLFKSGIPILQTIEIVSNAVGNIIIAEVLLEIRDEVQVGAGLAGTMKKYPIFPPIILQMIEIGEESGSLDDMLVKVSEYFDQEVEYGIKSLITSLGPLLLVIIFVMVLFLALAIFLPMWDIMKFVK